MFTRVFNTAKRILSRSPSFRGESEEPAQVNPRSTEVDTEINMVTTRRGTETPGAQSPPLSSARKGTSKRVLEVEDATTPTTKRRRRSARIQELSEEVTDESQQAMESDPEIHDTIAVTIPHRTRLQDAAAIHDEQPPASPKESRPGKENLVGTGLELPPTADAREQDHISTPEMNLRTLHTDILDSVISELGQREDDTPPTTEPINETDETAPTSIEKATMQNVQETIPAVESKPASISDSKIPHLRFDSEEPAEAPTSITVSNLGHDQYNVGEIPQGDGATEMARVHQEDDASDSDEAPEMVTTAAALSKAKAIKEEADRARKAQQEKEERRRKQRAERVAEEQAEKRKRDEKRAKKLAKIEAREAKAQRGQALASPEPVLGVDIKNLPSLLPSSILEAAGDHRPPTPPSARHGKTTEELRKEKLNRHIKFLERGEKPIKDLKKGSVNVAVLAQQNPLLAPKVNRDTKNIREHWLKGRRDEKRGKKGRKKPFQKFERKAVGGGFLRNGDD